MSNTTDVGFKDRTRLAEARERLRAAVEPHGRAERVPVESADGRTLAGAVAAERDVPGYRRAAMDGYAVRARDTFGASGRSPAVLEPAEGGVGSGEAVRVHTGSEVPDGADAVVRIEDAEVVGDGVEVFGAVPAGENVAPVGEDVEAGEALYDPGHRLRPSDLGMLGAAGIDEVDVYERPAVSVVPTGSELVESDPGPGEAVETNGLTVARSVERWGGRPDHRGIVPDDEAAIRGAIERDLDRDLVVTTGGSSVGERDLVPDVVECLGEVFVHGVALKPGHPVALGAVGDTPVVVLPGYPVSCLVNAVQFVRPALKWSGGMSLRDLPIAEARLDGKLASEPGVRTFARVRLERRDDGRVAVPVSASGAGVLSTVAIADGWVEIPERSEGIPAGETVAVQDWEWCP